MPAKKGNNFLQEMIDRDSDRKRENATEKKVMTFRDYLSLLREDHLIAQNSPARLREIVFGHGVEEIPEHERWLGVSKSYPLFTFPLFLLPHPWAC